MEFLDHLGLYPEVQDINIQRWQYTLAPATKLWRIGISHYYINGG
jgi:hypothetical protein